MKYFSKCNKKSIKKDLTDSDPEEIRSLLIFKRMVRVLEFSYFFLINYVEYPSRYIQLILSNFNKLLISLAQQMEEERKKVEQLRKKLKELASARQ